MEHFTPISGFIGGCLIGFAAIAFLYFNGGICGISGMIEGSLPPFAKEVAWRILFLFGLLFGGVFLQFFYPIAFDFTIESSFPIIFLGGFLVGFGSRLGKGCTSGHGVCGVGRIAPRSLLATVLFLFSAMMTASVLYLWGSL